MTPFEELVKETIGRLPELDAEDAWDSVENLNLIIALEKRYGVRFTSDKIHVYKTLRQLRDAIPDLQCPQRLIKAIALDCDGVLWSGVVGEDSWAGIAISYEFQRQIVELESRGYLICLCSKNNPEDVWEVFDKLDTPLKMRHIVTSEIGWHDKTEMLKNLADRLNIGLDSFIFVDDNPFERDRMNTLLPEVTVVVPSHLHHHCQHPLSFEGSLTQKYRAAIEFRKDRRFLESLGMKGWLYIDDESTAERCAELSQKTNQFNLHLRRYTSQQILERMEMDSYLIVAASLTDRYGDHGIVGLAVLMLGGFTELCISCRALGRGFEYAFVQECIKRFELQQPLLSYTEGPKNQQCKEFVERVNAGNWPDVPIEWIQK